MVEPVADRAPRLPGDSEDHGGDREGNQRVTQVEPARNDNCAQDDAEAYVRVGTGMVAVRDECGAVESPSRARANEGRTQVPEEADRARQPERDQMLGGFRI